ncbi:hypothetical protein [Pseudomonas fluorescens]|uniref:hypothetical protein n=1 Tax=Pseudomonas fluorescens TaxID=294 RepID=UPI00111725C4|nr:hypothetical protein [Pseudomonas fluorescens]
MNCHLHVRQHFHPVGHGTFFTGVVWNKKLRRAAFSWAYDCGARSQHRVEKAINDQNIAGWLPQEIDLLVLSHFDNDHVNGVEHFLRNRRVRWLAVPYMCIGQRVEEVLAGDASTCSASTALFQLDPVQWLLTSGLSEQVGAVIFVKGGVSGDERSTLPDRGDNPSPEWDELASRPSDDVFGSSLEPLLVDDMLPAVAARSKKWGGASFEMDHAASFGPGTLPLEFMFFNSDQPDLFITKGGARVARKSFSSIDVVQDQIATAIDSSGLSCPLRLHRNWRSHFKKVYEHHFGATSKQRNNISLCLMVRPLSEVSACSYFDGERSVLMRSSRRPSAILDRAGLLCLGDLCMDMPTFNSMQAHYGANRLALVAAVQVPHHGSQHSWVKGMAAKFSPDHFVHCIPDRCNGHHPHKLVTNDLHGFRVHRANGHSAVVLHYHFH